MKMNFSLSILFSLHDGKEIRYEGKWSGERRWDLPNDWIEVRVSPIEMANAETPENLAEPGRKISDHSRHKNYPFHGRDRYNYPHRRSG